MTQSTSDNADQDHSTPESVSLTVFDDYMATSNVGVTAFTSDKLSEMLGFYDQLAIQVVVDDTMVGSAPAALVVQILHSADGRNYLPKNASPEVIYPTQLNIGQPTYMAFGFDAGAAPSLAFVRLQVVLTGSVGPVRAHVRITVTGNNYNEQAFARTAQQLMKDQTAASTKYILIYGSGQKIQASTIEELVSFIRGFPEVGLDAIKEKAQDAKDVLSHGDDHTKDEKAEARAFLRWEPVFVLKAKGGFSGKTVTIPNGFQIAFRSNGQYLFLKNGDAIWQSTRASAALFSKSGPLTNDSVGVGVKEK